ncbi:hypothetical protein ACP70R_001738 [Stipagrostis hirtigluma subsp. patula]
MIQPVDMDEKGTATACRVHDMIHDLIISLSAEENFVTVSEGRQVISSVCKVRRLSLQRSKRDSDENDTGEEKVILQSTVNISHVRSIIAFVDGLLWISPLSRFSALRVLSLRSFPRKNNHPKGLSSLHHMRYLQLRGFFEKEFIEEIGNLQHLKTLDLCDKDIKELPASIVQLRQLECLIVYATGVKFPDGIGNITSLQELSWFSVKESPNALVELGKLTKLWELSIYGLGENESYVKTFLESLSNLRNIHTLKFSGLMQCSLDYTSDQWKAPAHLQNIDGSFSVFSELPRWFSYLSELSCLSIKVDALRQNDLQLLGDLPVLRFLKLNVSPKGSTEERLVIGTDQPFRSLTEFMFKHYTRCCLVFAPGAMRKLQRLKLYFEVKRREDGGFNTGLENLTSLKHVTVNVDCEGARFSVVQAFETMIKDAIGMHLNHPTLELSRKFEEHMVGDDLGTPEGR